MPSTHKIKRKSGRKTKRKPIQHRHHKAKELNKSENTKFRYDELECGTPIIQIHNPDENDITVECIITVGSAMEPRDKMGISHLIEHLVFRKTKHFASQQEMKNFLQKHAIYYNAYTDNTELDYYYSGPSSLDNLNYMLYMLKEMLLTSIFTEHSFETEKNIVLQELYRRMDSPGIDCWDKINAHYFKNHPLGVITSGTVESIKNITLEDAISYYKQVYVPANFIIYITGNIPAFDTNKPVGLCDYYINRQQDVCWNPKIHKLATKYNSTKPTGLTTIPAINNKLLDIRNKTKYYLQHTPENGGIKHLTKENMNQIYISFLFPINGRFSPDSHLTNALAEILRDGGETKLFSIIREKYGLSYVIHVNVIDYVEGGYLYLSIGVNKADCKRGLDILKDIFNKAKHGNFVSKEELDIYKKSQDSYYKNLKKYPAICFFTSGIKQLYKIRNIDDISERYLKIKLDELNKHAKDLLDLNKAIIYVYGDEKAINV